LRKKKQRKDRHPVKTNRKSELMYSKQKRMASEILNCGLTRVKVKPGKELEEALTRGDIRGLIENGTIYTVPKKGTSRWHARILLKQKKKKRRRGEGKLKGRLGTRFPKKGEWMKTVRALRKLLKELKENKQIEKNVYKKLYYQVKGGMFRNKKHMLYYLKEHKLLLGKKPVAKKKPKQETVAAKPKTEAPEQEKISNEKTEDNVRNEKDKIG